MGVNRVPFLALGLDRVFVFVVGYIFFLFYRGCELRLRPSRAFLSAFGYLSLCSYLL